MIRIIHLSDNNGTLEDIAIIDSNEEIDAIDFTSPGQKVISDTTHNISLPVGFPIGSTFRKIC